MNDYQTIMAILDKAHIPYQRDRARTWQEPIPKDSTAILIDTTHPHIELVFGPHRDLIAIWPWE